MNYEINLYISDIKSINRTIIVNDDIPIQLFVKAIILSMNGNTNALSELTMYNRIVEFDDDDNLSALHLNTGDRYKIIYDYDHRPWHIRFVVLKKNEGLKSKKIEIIDGAGNGILQSEDMFIIERLVNVKGARDITWRDKVLERSKTINAYFNSQFSLEESNKILNDYMTLNEDACTPKSIVMNISLNGFAKDIKRKVIVNNDISIDSFCRAVITSMKGDLSHLYTIKINKKWYDEDVLNKRLSYFELSKEKKIEIIYDYGDNWTFSVKVSKVIDGYNNKKFEILSGCGYGIVDDCGGVYGLVDVFNGESEYIESRDINEFNLQKLQEAVDKRI